jgi:hypothetical protein
MLIEIAFIRSVENEIQIITEDFQNICACLPLLQLQLAPSTELRTSGPHTGEIFYHLEVLVSTPSSFGIHQQVALATLFRGLADFHVCNLFSLLDGLE